MGSRRESGTRNSLLIRNLPPETTVKDIEEAFGVHGKLCDVYIPVHFRTREPRGFGFVQFECEEAAAAARRALNGTWIGSASRGRRGSNSKCSPLEVLIAKRGRSDPYSMRMREKHGYRDRDRSRSYSPRGQYHCNRSVSRSPSYDRRYRGRGNSSRRGRDTYYDRPRYRDEADHRSPSASHRRHRDYDERRSIDRGANSHGHCDDYRRRSRSYTNSERAFESKRRNQYSSPPQNARDSLPR